MYFWILFQQLLKHFLAKISFIIVITTFFTSCSVIKHLEPKQHMLKKNDIVVNGEKSKNNTVYNIIKPKPNKLFLGLTPFRLNVYNLSNKNPDSTFTKWLQRKPKREQHLNRLLSKKQTYRLRTAYLKINDWFQKSGEPLALIDSLKINKSIDELKKYYDYNGWRDININYTVDYLKRKRGIVHYNIEEGTPYKIDSVLETIASKAVDSIYQIHKGKSFLKIGEQSKGKNIVNDRNRITSVMRNNGLFTFEKEQIIYHYNPDSIQKTISWRVEIKDRKIRTHDGYKLMPFKVYKISEVNVFTDYQLKNKGKSITDSTTYYNHNFYSFGKQRFKAKALSDVIAIQVGDVYKDIDKSKTLNQLNNLKTFKYPDIKYLLDERDSTQTKLIANILLTPKKKFGLGYSLDALQNNIQSAGLAFSTSAFARNVFRRAENLELSFRGSIGASRDRSDEEDRFFDVREIGADLKLSFPRIFFPVNTKKIIPKKMMPTTRISIGASTQTNVGLDKTNVTGALNYQWFATKTNTHRIDLFNAQFIRNLNPNRYFSVYNNAFSRLNTIAINTLYTANDLSNPIGANQFINDVVNNNLTTTVSALITPEETQEVRNINERKNRLTENNLILTTNYSFVRNTREGLIDNSFSRFGFKIAFAGNTLATLSNLLKLEKNNNDKYELFNVEYSQYVKTEIDFVKHWKLSRSNTFAVRSFLGVALPYGNSNSIPFSESFFAGGSNDNRAWEAYSLGPGTSNGDNEFNEANMKISLNAEFRYNIFGDFKGAFFIDAGNIWNVLDNEEDQSYIFKGISSLGDLAVGSGAGLRYDFGFFVLRFDVGFKTHEPYEKNKKWMRNYNFRNATYNFGINYPF